MTPEFGSDPSFSVEDFNLVKPLGSQPNELWWFGGNKRERERGATFFFLLSSCWAISELQQPTNHSDAELKPNSLSCSRKVFGLAFVWKCTVVTFSWLSFFCEKFSPCTNYWCWWLRTKVSLLLLLIRVRLCAWTSLAAAAEVIEAIQRCCFEPKSTKPSFESPGTEWVK